MINYSIIIPHKNRIDLLSRCLDSLPKRNDIQIIIVDDNSDSNIVDFNKFPGRNDNRVEIYYTKEGKGAGYARNVGLLHAKGKWIIFADSDDYYLDNLGDMMESFFNSKADMIIFRHNRKNVKGIEKENHYDHMFDDAIATKNYENLILNFFCPYGRFIKKEFIDYHKIEFQEVKFSNDVMFMVKAGLFAKEIQVIDIPVYCVCETDNSLLRNNSWRNPYIRTRVSLDLYSFVLGLKDHRPSDNSWKRWWRFWWEKTYAKNKLAALFLLPEIYITTKKCPLVEMIKYKINSFHS